MSTANQASTHQLVNRRSVALVTPTDLSSTAMQEVAATLNAALPMCLLST